MRNAFSYFPWCLKPIATLCVLESNASFSCIRFANYLRPFSSPRGLFFAPFHAIIIVADDTSFCLAGYPCMHLLSDSYLPESLLRYGADNRFVPCKNIIYQTGAIDRLLSGRSLFG